jgi:Ataxin-3
MLCGLHTVNALLQGPYFDEVSISQIALKLDQEERALMGADAPELSHNVSMDGNYSI